MGFWWKTLRSSWGWGWGADWTHLRSRTKTERLRKTTKRSGRLRFPGGKKEGRLLGSEWTAQIGFGVE